MGEKADMTAIILAAGLGMRMGPRGKLMPKGLIEVGGEALVAQSVETLRRAGFDSIVVVTGHLAEQYEARFAATDVRLIHNPDYATTGSLRTLMVALETVSGPVALLESDLIYAPEVLEAVSPTADRFLVSTPTGAGDEVYTWVRPGAPGNAMAVISKDPATRAERPFGEMIGITSLSAHAVDRLRVHGQTVLAETPEAHYEDGIVALCQEVVIECVRFDGVPWAEIDDEEMLARAEREVWPRVKAARQMLYGTT
ncbi:MAG: phosphocholine cytidylyltransferase family protein [Pseudomonadota bacterium]